MRRGKFLALPQTRRGTQHARAVAAPTTPNTSQHLVHPTSTVRTSRNLICFEFCCRSTVCFRICWSSFVAVPKFHSSKNMLLYIKYRRMIIEWLLPYRLTILDTIVHVNDYLFLRADSATRSRGTQKRCCGFRQHCLPQARAKLFAASASKASCRDSPTAPQNMCALHHQQLL